MSNENEQGKRTILLVEDEESLLTLSRMMLAKMGFNVIATRDPKEALELADRHGAEIDLLISDMVMPGLDGLDMSEIILAAHPGMKVLFMSGYPDELLEEKGFGDYVFNFIQKPFVRQELAEKIEEILAE
jgi:two-component system, cell cycle sensor histidine kinase and response regulator CckA